MLRSRRAFEKLLDHDRIVQAIQAAEATTSGEIRIAIAPFFFGSLERRAERAFKRLGMNRTRHRNGVLIFVAPARKRFRVIGDEGIHSRVGQTHWDQVVADLSKYFAAAQYTEGLIAAVEAVGRELARHFPPLADGNPDELSDELAKG